MNSKSRLEISDGITTSNKLETAEVLNSFFQSTFTQERLDEIPVFPIRSPRGIGLADINVKEEIVLDRLSKLKPFKAPGPDGIHSYILRECSSSICKPLCMLFNQSLQCGQLPHDWKCANVIPVFKKGSLVSLLLITIDQ